MRSTPRQVMHFTIVTDFFSRYPNILSMVHTVCPPLTCCTRVVFTTSPQYPHSVYKPHHIPPWSPPLQELNQLPPMVQPAVSVQQFSWSSCFCTLTSPILDSQHCLPTVTLDFFFPTWAPGNSSSHWLMMQIPLLAVPLSNDTLWSRLSEKGKHRHRVFIPPVHHPRAIERLSELFHKLGTLENHVMLPSHFQSLVVCLFICLALRPTHILTLELTRLWQCAPLLIALSFGWFQASHNKQAPMGCEPPAFPQHTCMHTKSCKAAPPSVTSDACSSFVTWRSSRLVPLCTHRD